MDSESTRETELRDFYWSARATLGHVNESEGLAMDSLKSDVRGWLAIASTTAGVAVNDPSAHYSTEPHNVWIAEIDGERMVAAGIIAAVDGVSEAVGYLAGLLVTEPVNRKIRIARFLWLITSEELGTKAPEIPTKPEVLKWAERARNNQFKLSPPNPESLTSRPTWANTAWTTLGGLLPNEPAQ